LCAEKRYAALGSPATPPPPRHLRGAFNRKRHVSRVTSDTPFQPDATPVGAVVRTKIGSVWLGVDGVVRGVVEDSRRPGDVEDAEENLAALRQVGGGRRRPVLSDARKVGAAEREASRVFAARLPEVATAYGVLVGSPLTRMLAAVLLRLDTPALPTRTFTDERAAVEWLAGFRDDD